jgi:HEAT repeat protein
MGLVKSKKPKASAAAPRSQPSCLQWAALLEDADAPTRRQAARQLVHCPDAAQALVGRMRQEPDLAVRQAIGSTLVRLNDPSALPELGECLRSDDAALRNEAIEIFKLLTCDLSSALQSLLLDPDPDVRILTINILESRRNPDVERSLLDVLQRDQHVNVCATAVDLLCEVGTDTATEALLSLKQRFPAEPYLQFATDLALKRIRES